MSNDKKVINHLISIIILSTLIILFSLGELGLIIITLSLMYFIIYSIITYQTTMTNNKQSMKLYTEEDLSGMYRVYAKHFAVVNFPYLSKEEFINRIKTDDEFTKTWGDLGYINDIEKNKGYDKISK